MASESVKLPPADASDSLVSNKAVSSGTASSSSSRSGSKPAQSLSELSEKLSAANAKIEYQGQLLNSMHARICVIEREMKRLIDENDYLVYCVQDPDFPQRQRSREMVQQLRQINEARKGQSGVIQPAARPS